MRSQMLRLSLFTCLLAGAATAAQAEVCIAIDAARDALPANDQAAALLLVTRQFEQAGESVVPGGCPRLYSVSHVRLGNTFVVNISGPDSQREAIAHGMDDLPALYSQMVRSIVTGRPMTGFNVIDRTNITAAQASARRVHSDSLWYARLGYGSLFGDSAYSTPALGFGYRAEIDSFAIDLSFLNLQINTEDNYSSAGASAQSLLKLSGLYFLDPTANSTGYFGGGLSYGRQTFGGSYNPATSHYTTDFDGNGLQAELTAGYELARVTGLRIFVQADAILPFYEATAETWAIPTRFGPTTITTDRRYAPSLLVSIGLGR